MTTGGRIRAGTVVEPHELITIHSERIRIPDQRRLVHLEFRRYAACPICKLHLRSFQQRYAELVQAGILEVVVFHSSQEIMLQHQNALPFAAIADPAKKLYLEFGVGKSVRSLLDPRAVRAALRALRTIGSGHHERGVSGLGLPADFLIAPNGEVLACKYGVHADDHWSVDEVLALAASNAPNTSS